MNKTNELFPCISDGYAHEQYNKLIKSDGQVVRILDSTNALLRFGHCFNLDITNTKSHHENNQPFEKRFQKNVTDLVQKFLT